MDTRLQTIIYQIHFIGLEMRLVFVNPGDDGVDVMLVMMKLGVDDFT